MNANVSQENWAGGELSPKMYGRYTLPIYANGAERLYNFISETSGPTRFRNGSMYVINTRRNKKGVLYPFQFSDSQSYELEFTEGYIRFMRNNGVLVFSSKTITGITQANPAVVTSAGHGYSNGDEVILSGIKGMTQLNNRSFVVAGVAANTFQLTDNDGNNINSSTYTAYSSAGIAEKIVEVVSPYLEADLYQLKTGQNADTMYIVHPNYEPRKLTRSSATSWALALFSRTADPFTSKKVITGLTQANPAVVTAVGHGLTTGTQIIIESVGGMTQINSKRYLITVLTVDTFSLQDLNGVNIDSSAYTAYTAGGYASDKTLLPGAFCFYQGRAIYGYSDAYPQSFWGSRALDSSGNPRYDDMTTGTNPDDGFKFTLSPITGKVDRIEALTPAIGFLSIGTFEGISKADGGNSGDAITPSNIAVTPTVTQGILREISPILLGLNLVYIHRSGLIFYSLEFDIFYNAYNAIDKNLTNDHMTDGGLIQMVYQIARPMAFWMVRNDGIIVGATYIAKENVNAWHRHQMGGTSAKALSVGNMPRPTKYDQLWVIVERTINGHTRRYVEYFTDEVTVPDKSDFYTSDANKVSDDAAWRNAMFEVQKQLIHMDSTLVYDGTIYGTNAGATMTPGALTGTGVTFTASAAVFDATMVGRQIWKQAQKGIGTGRAVITAYISTTQVTCTILTDFNVVTAMAAGQWYLTTSVVSGAWHLEGETVRLITDGAEHPDKTVASGSVTLDYQSSYVQLGEGYSGYTRSMNIEGAGEQGPAQTKPKNINRLGVRLLNTLGVRYGTDLYTMEEIPFRNPNDDTDRPPPLFTGDKRLPICDDSALEKHIFIQQLKSLPCTVLMVVPFVETDNE